MRQRTTCKECKNASDTKRLREDYRQKLITDPVALRVFSMIKEAKKRAKQKQLAFDLHFEWAIEKFKTITHCPILGFSLDWRAEKTSTASPTLDRIRPELGYVKDNVQIISHRANAMKQDASLEEMVMLGKWAEQKASQTINKITIFEA
jgi:hypothetical protein